MNAAEDASNTTQKERRKRFNHMSTKQDNFLGGTVKQRRVVKNPLPNP